MKANMFPRPEVAAATKDLVLVELYTDGNDKTVDEYQKLEDEKFKTAAQPLYAIFDANENALATFEGSTTDVSKFLAFLSKGAS
jgi:thiol:disulfide interchange protein DsbD